MEFKHVSVMLNECIDGLNIKPDGIYVDGTLGGAGHSSEILRRLDTGLLIGIDKDQDAIRHSTERLKEIGSNFMIVHSDFSNVKNVIEDLEIEGIDGMLLDLGVSSYQLDTPERGFSYNHDSKLDMRMNRESGHSAYQVVNEYSADELNRIISDYGEERWSKRISEFIVEHRPIETTFELVEVIKKAIPKKARIDGPHPAKRTFQAIRIEVNNELGIIENTIKDAVGKMNKGGRMVIITFHSLEDRIVKNTFKELSTGCICPKEFPICTCGQVEKTKLVTRKPLVPSMKELEFNPRSRSAKVRIIEKL